MQKFWESGMPSPRVRHPNARLYCKTGEVIIFHILTRIIWWQCVAVDACVEHDLVDALQVSDFPEILFTHAGKILHRDKGM